MKILLQLMHRNLLFIVHLLVIISASHIANAQVTLRSGFVEDSLLIGDEVSYYLTATYPAKLKLLFPDSTFAFQPFEFQRKKFFTTVTQDSSSYDSTIYFLSTFEVDKVQLLQLPAFILHEKDCTIVLANLDSIHLKELVKIPLPDTLKATNLPLISNTAYEPVDWLLNYPIILYLLVGILIVSILAWLFFGKRIRKHFELKKLQRTHTQFLQVYDKRSEKLKTFFSKQDLERQLTDWKKYLENFNTIPYTKLTTKEIVAKVMDEEMGESLRRIDKAIYGWHEDISIEEPLLSLRNQAIKKFNEALNRITDG